MRRGLKIAAISAAALAGVALVLAAAVRVFLPPEKARGIIERQLTTRLERPVTLGAVSVGLFTGLRVSEFSIGEGAEAGGGTFVSSEALRLRVSLLPLLARKIVVNDVRLVKPSVRIVRFPDGRYNFSDITSSTAPAAPPRESGGFQVIVTGVSLTDGRLRFEDRSAGGRSVTVDPLDASLSGLTPAGNAGLEARLGVESGGVAATLSLAGRINALKGSFRIDECRLTSGDSVIDVTGEATELRGRPAFDVAVAIERLDLAVAAGLAPALAAFRPEGGVSGAAKATGRPDDFIFDARLDLGQAGFSVAETFSKPPGKSMTIASNGRLERASDLTLDRLVVGLGALETSASGRVDGLAGSTPTFRLSVRTNAFPASEALARLPADAIPPEISLGGDVALSAKFDGTARAGDIDVSLDAVGLKLTRAGSFDKPAGTPLTLRGEGRYAGPATVTFRRFEAVLSAMKLAGRAAFSSGPKGARWSATLESDPFPLDRVAALSPAAASYAPSGTATLDIEARNGKPGAAPEVRGKFTLEGGAARYQASSLTEVSASGRFTADSVDLPAFRAKLNGAPLRATVAARDLDRRPDIVAHVDAAELDLGKLLPAAPPAPKKTDAGRGWIAVAHAAGPAAAPMSLSGTLKAARVKHPFFEGRALDVAWDVAGVTPALDRLSGTASLKHGAGEFRDIRQLTAGSRAARVLFLPLSVLRKVEAATGGAVKMPSMDRVPFSSITGDYAFRDGVMRVSSFALDADAFDAALTGTVGLAGDQPVDARAEMTLRDGRTTLAFDVSGTVAAPTARLDLEDAGRQAIEALKKSDTANEILKKLGLPGLK